MVSFVKKNSQIVFIGAGNVATHLSLAMQEAGFSIAQIFSRCNDSAQTLAEELNCSYTTNINEMTTEASLYIFAVKDDALQDMIAAMPSNKGIWTHTSGSLSIDIFRGYTDSYGVIYPLQTISKHRETDLSKAPLFIEGNSAVVETAIYHVADRLSDSVTILSSEKRKYLHLAAVFACNFSNHMYTIASQILEKQGIDRHVLQPLINETAKKLCTMHPVQAQTGPAVRGDLSIMELHQALLDDEQMRRLYAMISESIISQHINKERQ